MTSPVRASVVVPTYNRPDVLEECVRALVAQAPDTPAYEVIVVDDGSRVDLSSLIESLAGAARRVRYVRHDTNRGRSATRNTGIDLAEGEIVLLVDDDVVVAPRYVAAHLAVHEAAGDAHLVVVGNLSFPPKYSGPATMPGICSRGISATVARAIARASTSPTCIRDSSFRRSPPCDARTCATTRRSTRRCARTDARIASPGAG